MDSLQYSNNDTYINFKSFNILDELKLSNILKERSSVIINYYLKELSESKDFKKLSNNAIEISYSNVYHYNENHLYIMLIDYKLKLSSNNNINLSFVICFNYNFPYDSPIVYFINNTLNDNINTDLCKFLQSNKSIDKFNCVNLTCLTKKNWSPIISIKFILSSLGLLLLNIYNIDNKNCTHYKNTIQYLYSFNKLFDENKLIDLYNVESCEKFKEKLKVFNLIKSNEINVSCVIQTYNPKITDIFKIKNIFENLFNRNDKILKDNNNDNNNNNKKYNRSSEANKKLVNGKYNISSNNDNTTKKTKISNIYNALKNKICVTNKLNAKDLKILS